MTGDDDEEDVETALVVWAPRGGGDVDEDSELRCVGVDVASTVRE